MTRETANKIRQHIIHHWDAEKVRITKNGEIHALGKMPNTGRRGWWLAGFDTNILAEIEDEERDNAWAVEDAAKYAELFAQTA